MAKQQTFVDKSKKKGGGTDMLSVKVVMVDKGADGNYKFNERFVKVKDLADVEKAARS